MRVGFPEGLKLLRFYAEFLAAPNFYTFTLLAHFFLSRLRAARASRSRRKSKNENRKRNVVGGVLSQISKVPCPATNLSARGSPRDASHMIRLTLLVREYLEGAAADEEA